MERKVTKLENSHIEVLVTVDEATWKAAQAKAFKKQAANVEIKGFRKGNAPEHLVKSKVNQVQVMDDAINGLLPELYTETLKVENIRPVARPKVDVTKLSDVELEVKFTLVVAPEVKLGQYKGLTIGKTEVTVEAAEVDAAIKELLASSATLVVKEGASELGDTVVIDFVGTIDGVAFEGGTAQNHELELGSHSFIPGFEEQLVGHVAGDHVDVKVTFPENYTPELKGKDAVFACDIHEVKSKKLPELTEEFIKELSIPNVLTEDDLRANKKAELLNRKTNETRREYMGKLLDAIVASSEIELAEEIIESQIESRKEDLTNRMAQSGLKLEQYLQIVGQKEEDFLAKLREEAIRDTKNFFVVDTVGKLEDVTVTNEEIEFEYAKIADQYKMTVEDVKKALEPQLEEFRNNLRTTRIEELLYNENN
jgi:trigger factor